MNLPAVISALTAVVLNAYRYFFATAATIFGWNMCGVAEFKLISISVTESVAEILGLNDATPAPTISVPDETAALVAVPEVALSDNPPTSV